MSDKQRKLKEQLMDHYSQALDELFADCSKDDDFVKFEEQVEKLASNSTTSVGCSSLETC